MKAVSKTERVVDIIGIKSSILVLILGAIAKYLEEGNYLLVGILAIMAGANAIAIYYQGRPQPGPE